MLQLLRFLRPYKVPIAIVLVLLFLEVMADLYLPKLLADIVNNGIVDGNTAYILRIGGFMLFVSVIGVACAITANYMSAKVTSKFGKDIRSKVFSHVEHFSLHEFDRVGTASLITRTTNDITQVQEMITMMMRTIVTAPFMCIGGVILALSTDVQLSWVIVGMVPILVVGTIFFFKKILPLYDMIQNHMDQLNLTVGERLNGIRVIRSLNRSEHENYKFDEVNTNLTNVSIKVNQYLAIMMPLILIVSNFASVAIIGFGSFRVDAGHMQVGDLIAFLEYAMQIMFSLISVSIVFIMFPQAQVSAKRILQLLNTTSEFEHTEPTIVKQPTIANGHISFTDVTFRYEGAEKPSLSRISFQAKPGETVAIIGSTGSGKTTLINLIPRFYEIESGSIRIDGVDVKELPFQQLRQMLGLVPQKAVLFSGSVAENIRFGKPSATDEEVERAASIAQATDFVKEMKDGFSSVIAQGGVNVSGGQKQRISIARALVRQPLIYLFDDSFSALDYQTDAKLRAALRQDTTQATVLIVAQRVSTVKDADRILVLEQGELVGEGTHKELMKTCNVYQEIVSSQLSEEESA
ncbi:ABC transporter ATP-binding protein [Paenibacillus sp. 481]|uniref:ABC transporter ATP-binding protein n=1 Tax=Paenibacillus sp. 481 TaxID=2835869 RepID=UPI001E5DDA35|nr:ABC transporter ATP-binding protein [Paenibacillus sp. 481]UHA73159.1 ABC transporter ATP-binding protein [Paenibacillus sp. 481]